MVLCGGSTSRKAGNVGGDFKQSEKLVFPEDKVQALLEFEGERTEMVNLVIDERKDRDAIDGEYGEFTVRTLVFGLLIHNSARQNLNFPEKFQFIRLILQPFRSNQMALKHYHVEFACFAVDNSSQAAFDEERLGNEDFLDKFLVVRGKFAK